MSLRLTRPCEADHYAFCRCTCPPKCGAYSVRSEGAVFTGAHVASPLCAPSRYNTLAGRYASRSSFARDSARNDGNSDDTAYICEPPPLVAPTSPRVRAHAAAHMPATVWDDSSLHSRCTELNHHCVCACAVAPSSHLVGVWARADNQMVLGAGEDTVQRRLAAAGYSTVLAGKWHLGLEAADPEAVHASSYDQLVSAVGATGFTTVAAAYESNIDRESLDGGLAYSHNLDWCTAAANAAIVEAVAGGSTATTPFFLFFTPTVPHTPSCYEALTLYNSSSTPAGLLDTPPDPGFAMSRAEIVQHADDWAATMAAAVGEYSSADIERTQNAVAGLTWLDQALGSLLSTLEATAALNNTVVVLTIDHGQGRKALLSTGEGIRVPLMVRYPVLFEAGTIVAGYTTNLDHAPSFLALAGIVGDGVEGSAMSTDGTSWAGDSFVENETGVGGDGSVLQLQPRCLFFEVRLDRAVVCSSAVAGGVAGMKLVVRSPLPGAAEGYCAINPLSLHNVSADPAESNELSQSLGSGPQAALAALQSRLDCHAASTGLENDLAVDPEGNASGASAHSGVWTESECGDADPPPPASDHGADGVADGVDLGAGGLVTLPTAQSDATSMLLDEVEWACADLERFKLYTGATPAPGSNANMYSSMPNVVSAAQCAAQCLGIDLTSDSGIGNGTALAAAALPACRAFTYEVSPGGGDGGQCSLYERRVNLRNLDLDVPGSDFYQIRWPQCKPACTSESSSGLDRLTAFPGARPTHASSYIVKFIAVDLAECSAACAASTAGCRSFSYIDEPSSPKVGLCQHYRKRYTARYQTPHALKTFYHLNDCVAPCPAITLGRFIKAGSRRPRFASNYNTRLAISSLPECAEACIAAGPGRCASFLFKRGDQAADCRFYGQAYDCQYVRESLNKDYYILRIEQCIAG